jgi:hypothetical protein
MFANYGDLFVKNWQRSFMGGYFDKCYTILIKCFIIICWSIMKQELFGCDLFGGYHFFNNI